MINQVVVNIARSVSNTWIQRIKRTAAGRVSVKDVFVNYTRRTQRDHVRNGGRELGECTT